jgi:hypothetical protein
MGMEEGRLPGQLLPGGNVERFPVDNLEFHQTSGLEYGAVLKITSMPPLRSSATCPRPECPLSRHLNVIHEVQFVNEPAFWRRENIPPLMVDFRGYLYYLNPVYFRNLEKIEAHSASQMAGERCPSSS